MLADPDSLRELVHEIKTPLNAIIGFAEIIDGQYLGPADRRYRERAGEIVGAGAAAAGRDRRSRFRREGPFVDAGRASRRVDLGELARDAGADRCASWPPSAASSSSSSRGRAMPSRAVEPELADRLLYPAVPRR